MEKQNYDFSSMGLPPEGVNSIILQNCYVVQIGLDARVAMVVPFSSLGSVVMMALSAGSSVVIKASENSDLCVLKSTIKGVTSL